VSLNNSQLGTSHLTLKLEDFQAILDVPLTLSAELDQRKISVSDLLALEVGSLLPLTRPTGENLDLYAGDVLLGSGEILVIDSGLAVRVAELRHRTRSFLSGENTSPETDLA
jgi:flagellar motor switch protein FliN